MRRPWQIWLALGLCVLVAVVAVGWLSYRALESEHAEQFAQGRAGLEENARLALWRLDSAVASLVAEENARPYFEYRPFYSTIESQGESQPGASTVVPPGKGKPAAQKPAAQKPLVGRVVPSPLLSAIHPQIKLHFEIDSQGEFHSPRVPSPALLERVVPRYLSQQAFTDSSKLLAECARLVDRPALLAALPAAEPQAPAAEGLANSFLANDSQPPQLASVQPQQGNTQPAFNQSAIDNLQQASVQQAKGDYEFQARRQALTTNFSVAPLSNSLLLIGDVQTAVMTPLWVGPELLLARRVIVGGQASIQGCWLDWPIVREQLLGRVCDLLPGAQLEPADSAGEPERAHMMAALPLKLVTGELPLTAADRLSPVRLSLLVTWGSLLLAAVAVALLLGGVLALSERRAAFVSAVTHELRTPLTTFRMYAEMLAEGMVPDEATRRKYLETLRVEADRLTHLVENVLAYARLERGGPGACIGPVPVAELLDGAGQRLADRARQAGFDVRIEAPHELLAARAVADPAAVEQILFNLVDNACKYARTAQDRTLELAVTRENGHVALRLRDHGQGVGERERKRLFQPFRKSACDAAHSAPGVGLGLALSRRLARDMGGDLALEPEWSAGASFLLTLRVGP
jgi:signal transduction histidine kinase